MSEPRPAPAISPGDIRYRPARPGEEADIVALLNAAYRTPWGSLEKWRTKHGDRPGFNAAHIILAEHEGRLAGCLHTARRWIRFEGAVIRQSFDGDLGVDPKFKGVGIPEKLYAVSTQEHYKDGVELRGGFTQAQLWERFYRPRIGYVSGFDGTRAFRKILSARPLRERIAGALKASPGKPGVSGGTVIEFRVQDLDPIRFRMTAEGFHTVSEEGSPAGPRLAIHIDQRLFGPGHGSEGRAGRLARLLLSGAVRMTGAIWKAPALAVAILKARRGGNA